MKSEDAKPGTYFHKGFNVIKFNSERNSGGVNHAVLKDFDKVLTPETVAPTKP